MASIQRPSLLEIFTALDIQRRATVIGMLLVTALGMWKIGQWAYEPAFVSLYSDLQLTEASDMTQILDAEGITSKLGVNGTELLVVARDAVAARVALAGAGHSAAGSPGLELFDSNTWGMTGFTQRITQQRALEGELERTIGRFRGVENAEVHLTLSETGPLKNLLRGAKAGVVLSARGRGTIPMSSVEGIARLVANAVPDLEVGDVAVLDNSGVLLTSTVENDPAAAIAARRLERQRQVESEQASKIDALLTSILGPGHANIQVSVELNFEQIDRTTLTYDPEGQVISSEQRSDVQPGNGAGASGQSTQITNQFQNSQTTERVINSGGEITRLTVAVALDRVAVEEKVGTNVADVTRFANEMKQMANDAVGIDPSRGDRLSVTLAVFNAPLSTQLATAEPALEPGLDVMALVEQFSKPATGILGVLLTFALATKFLKPVLKAQPRRLAKNAAAVDGGESSETGRKAIGPGAAPLIDLPKLTPSIGSQIKDQIFQETEDIGETGARVVRSWLGEAAG